MAFEQAKDEQDPTPQSHGRKGKGTMDEDEFHLIIKAAADDAIQYTDKQLSPERAEATKDYAGGPLGNEEDGRSQIVVTEVRDGIQALLPSILRVFFGTEQVVEFTPKTEAGDDEARQATDFVQHVLTKDNNGFLLTHAVLKDGLLKKMGIFKWGWDKSDALETYRMENTPEPELEALLALPGVKLVSSVEVKDAELVAAAQPPAPTPAPGAPPTPPPAPVKVFDIEITKENHEGRARIWAIPPEEFIFDREARDLETASYVAHRTMKTQGELIAMGIDEEVIEEHGGNDNALSMNPEDIARREGIQTGVTRAPTDGESEERCLYIESYIRVDYNGDGVSELRRVCTIGTAHHVVTNVPVKRRPFALFCPDPEPHTMLGQSWRDRLKDMQRFGSSLLRGVSDSMSMSIFPRTAVVENKVNIKDAMNTEIGAVIRTKDLNAVQSFSHPFVGAPALQLLDYKDSIVERRTGKSKGTAGLDAKALQSSTEGGVQSVLAMQQEQQELLCRLFAEGTLKPMFMGLLELLHEHQPRARMVSLRGRWVDVNPKIWDTGMDVSVSVALGPSFAENRVSDLMQIAAKQEQILQTMGPSNPLVSLAQLRNTYCRILEAKGFRNVTSFFNDVDPNWQPAPQQPQETPEQTLAQAQLAVEKMKTERELQIKEAELNIKREHQFMENERQKQKMAFDHEIALAKINAENHTAMTTAQLDANVSKEMADSDRMVALHGQAHDQLMDQHGAALAAQGQDHAQGLAEDAQSHAQGLAEQAAAAPDAGGGE